MRLPRLTLACAIFLFVAIPAMPPAPELKQETLIAWDAYLTKANLRMQGNFRSSRIRDAGPPFLWVDEQSDRSQRVRRGEILIAPVGEPNPQNVSDGLIHDWIGAIFIPNTRIAEVFAVVQDFNHYKDFYKPTVIQSQLLRHAGEEYEFTILGLKKVLFERVVLEGQFESHCSELDATRRYCISSSTRIQELKDYGQHAEHKLPPDEGHGYIWRIYGLTKFEERDDGVYMEVEAIALSRDIPSSLRWLTRSVVERVSRESMSTILERTKDAVEHRSL